MSANQRVQVWAFVALCVGLCVWALTWPTFDGLAWVMGWLSATCVWLALLAWRG